MNLENIKDQTKKTSVDEFEFDFKPITSGLGFHSQKPTEIKPVFTERTAAVQPAQTILSPKKDSSVYQSDLAMFYGQAQAHSVPELPLAMDFDEAHEKGYRLATKPQRVFAYFTDLFLITAILGAVLTVMARLIHMDFLEAWTLYPNELTPLVLTLFCGFYLIYFSIFEKTHQSTFGKNLFGLRVTGLDEKPLGLLVLVSRSLITLLNFISLGLFSYFDLQDKVTSAKVIRID